MINICSQIKKDLARFNPSGVRMDADMPTVRTVFQYMKAKGKGIIGMKVLGADRLSNRVDECLQFQLGSNCIDCFTIGQESVEQFNDLHYCKWFHVCEHESNHNGQIKFIKKRLS